MRLHRPLLELARAASGKCYVCGRWSLRSRLRQVQPHGLTVRVDVCGRCAEKMAQAQAVMRAIKGS